MIFREATAEDYDYVAEHSISRGKPHPDRVFFSYTLEHEGKPLGIGGFQLLNYDTAWCWLDLAELSSGYTKAVYRVVKEWMENFVKDNDIKRLQATIECDFDKAIRLVKHLGFKKESIMEKYVEGRDAFLYRRLF